MKELKEMFTDPSYWFHVLAAGICIIWGMFIGGAFDEPEITCVYYDEGTEPGFVGEQIYVCEIQGQQGILIVSEHLEQLP